MSWQKKKGCFTDENLIKAITKGLDPEKKKRLSLHLESCSLCRRKFLLLVELREYVNVNFKNNKLSTNQVSCLKQQAAPRLAELERKITSRTPGRSSRHSLWWVSALLGLIFVSAAIRFFWLRPGKPILRDSTATTIRGLNPAGKIAAPPVEFRWEKISGAKSYEFILTDENLSALYAQRTTAPYLFLPEAKRLLIKKGKIYIWIIEALDETEQKTASASRSFFFE